MKLLLAEDEKRMNRALCEIMRQEGYDVTSVDNGEDALYEAESGIYDLIVLDVMMPGMNGYAVAKKTRAAGVRTPILMLTAKGELDDKVEGLDSGADDYLAKPFGMLEMVSRIKAVLRRTSPKQSSILVCGDISLDESKHTVTVFDRPVLLTLKEYELLKLFMENPGRVFTRDILLAGVWGQDFIGETRTVDVHIGTLRTKLAEAGDLIHTVRGVGYKMEENHES